MQPSLLDYTCAEYFFGTGHRPVTVRISSKHIGITDSPMRWSKRHIVDTMDAVVYVDRGSYEDHDDAWNLVSYSPRDFLHTWKEEFLDEFQGRLLWEEGRKRT